MLTDTFELDADASNEIRRCAEELNLPPEGTALILATARAEAEAEPASEAYARLLAEIDARTDLSPVDRDALLQALNYFGQFVTTLPIMVVEEGSVQGGLGSAILEFYALQGVQPASVHLAGVPDVFVEHATVKEQREEVGLSAEHIAQRLASLSVRKRQRAT